MIWSTYGDELDRVMLGNTVRHPAHGGAGGEWDTLRRAPRGVLRRLTGARLLTPHGEEPDVAATYYIGPNAGIWDVCEAMEWYLRICILFVDDRQRIANFERHIKLARRHGCRSYFEYRDGLSKLGGYPSYHYERKQRWPT